MSVKLYDKVLHEVHPNNYGPRIIWVHLVPNISPHNLAQGYFIQNVYLIWYYSLSPIPLTP
ncbi:MAG: hypothetical protein WA902_09115, partial [Thermosynechococcaceae cyanobacterium]